MQQSNKYPRTYHMPNSPGGTSDDKRLKNLNQLIVHQPLIITEKMDGSNVCLTSQELFARSHSGIPKHPSFDLLKQHHAFIKNLIPDNESWFGEWCYAVHSIKYDKLPNYLFLFGVRNDETNIWENWDYVQEAAKEIGCLTVPVLEVFNGNTEQLNQVVDELTKQNSVFGGCREGIVIRSFSDFHNDIFSDRVVKWVRKDHVQTDQHWKDKKIEIQNL